jgi:phosphoenolpyruvate-protein kinase (PTS system EI component)
MQEKFIAMGYTELSMAAGRILETRKLVNESNV